MRDTLFLSFGLISEFIFDSWMYFLSGWIWIYFGCGLNILSVDGNILFSFLVDIGFFRYIQKSIHSELGSLVPIQLSNYLLLILSSTLHSNSL